MEMSSWKQLSLLTVLSLLVLLNNVQGQLTCFPPTSIRRTVQFCITGVDRCFLPPGNVIASVGTPLAGPSGSCTITKDLSVTFNDGAIVCSTEVVSCVNGVVVPVTFFRGGNYPWAGGASK